MLPADDDDLRPGIDVVDSAVVVPIAMPILESSECVLLREILWHRLLPLKSSDRSEVRREASSTADEDSALRGGYLTRFSLPSPRPYPIGLQGPGSQGSLRPSSRVPGMQGAKPIRSLPLDAQAVAARQSNLAVNSSQDSTLCLSTRGNLWVNNTESPSPACILYSLTRATFGLTTKREGERVSGSERSLPGRSRASLVNRSRGCSKRDPGAGTTAAVSRRTRAPTALATGAPRMARPEDSGLMMAGSSGRTRTYNPPVNSRMLYH